MATYGLSITDFLTGQISNDFHVDVVVVDTETHGDVRLAVIADFDNRAVLQIRNDHPQVDMVTVTKTRALHVVNPVFYENARMLISGHTTLTLTKLPFSVPDRLFIQPKEMYKIQYDTIRDVKNFSPTPNAEKRTWHLTKVTITGDSQKKKGPNKYFRELQLEDESTNESVDATLWEAMADSPVKIGDIIEIQHAGSKVYNAKRKLMINESPKTKVIKLETPRKTIQTTFDGIFKIEPKDIVLLDQNGRKLSISKDSLYVFLKDGEMEAINPESENFIDFVLDQLPFAAEIEILGSSIQNIK